MVKSWPKVGFRVWPTFSGPHFPGNWPKSGPGGPEIPKSGPPGGSKSTPRKVVHLRGIRPGNPGIRGPRTTFPEIGQNPTTIGTRA